MQSSRSLDIVLFGATGFTGRLTADYLARAADGGRGARWALAGRNRAKLEAVRDQLAARERPELIVADSSDRPALDALAASTRVVISTAGPYGRYGEPLLAACAAAGTDYVDLTGESPWARAMAERYHEQAAATGAKIVNSCGFDSIPSDLGVLFTIRALERRVPGGSLAQMPVSIEGFALITGEISGGTWQSMLSSMSEQTEFVRKADYVLPGRRVHQARGRIGFRKQLGFWALPSPTIDPDVVCRSALLNERYGCDFRYSHYMGMKHLPELVGMGGAMGTLFGLSKSRTIRDQLCKLMPSGTGPSAEQRSRGHFRVIILGRAGDTAAEQVRCEVRGGDPGYSETSKMLAESALCLVQDRQRLPKRLGVIPSAVAFGEVLIERLSRAGITFEEIQEAQVRQPATASV